eukprot:CAMPEP_0113854936 /NCGR_PEP_ID=MMETSP0372-20130328/7780_1 /TAXON_ID=340204 /ORGANISM="Lankesteria abbotti" /LENGTH=168 /DNA_ID=CAMNT_0000828527 /DNA_START=30 /DNA_END=533 /DNA_ORIENTATION=- /assembly_acc=CAM_ASM_000359
MTTVHSGGQVDVTDDRRGVLTSLSSEFHDFAICCEAKGLKFCCVTFCDQKFVSHDAIGRCISGEDIVRTTLKNCNAKFRLVHILGHYPPLYDRSRYYVPLGLDQPMHMSKNFHLEEVCKRMDLTKNEILLVDDDRKNCRAAEAAGYLALAVGKPGKFSVAELTNIGDT